MPRGVPPVGYPVQYFRTPEKSTAPLGAVITESTPQGMCKLSVSTPGGGTVRKQYVYIAGDPELARRQGWGLEWGVWDYIPGMPRLGEITDDTLSLDAEIKAEADRKALDEIDNLKQKKRVKA